MNTHEFGEEIVMEVDEEEKEPILVKCPRCGEMVEVDSEDEEYDHCDNCEDWIECECCSEWKNPEGSGFVHVTLDNASESKEWCESCISDNAYWCEHCEEYFEDELNSVSTGRRSPEKHFCDTCCSSEAWKCEDCDQWFMYDVDNAGYDYMNLCQSCYDDNHHFCEHCDSSYHNDHPCDCDDDDDEERDGGSCGERIKPYGQHGRFKKHETLPGPMIGLEMEVGSFDSPNNGLMDDYVTTLGEDFAFPTRDGSLSRATGIEFIGHPRTALDHLAIWGDYEKFFELMETHEARLDLYPSGCHTNMKLLREDGMRAATIAVERFRSALMLFTDPASRRRRESYVHHEQSIKDDPKDWQTQKGHGATQLKPHDDLVEFRIAGMTLDIHRFHAQIQLYHNLWSWCDDTKDPWLASYIPFDEIFLPTMFNNHIADVIEMGMSIGPMKVNVGSIDKPVPRRQRAA